ncbi:hypothetical protein DN585_04405 [Intrasporangium calvum]|nr:hypothetical protein DN585_04405 [Intrasporangium calvum]
MLLRFFIRRVTRMGVLRSTAVKVLALAAVGTILVTGAIAAYFFLEPMASEPKVWGLLFEMSTVSVVLWVQIAFLLVKVLFLNASGMLELSFHLPLTNRERAAALLIYEAMMAGVVSAVGFTSLTAAAVALLGPAVVPRLLEAIVFPIILTYLALSAAYLVLGRVLSLIGLRRVQGILLILVMFGLLTLYASRLGPLSSQATAAYLSDRTEFVWVAALAWLAHQYGPVAMAGVFLLAAGTLVAVALWATPSEHVPHSRYLNVPFGWPVARRLGPYDRCLLRSSQTWLAIAVAVAVFVGLCLEPVANPLGALAVLSMSGLYQFASTEPLRVLVADGASAWRTYGRLVKAQFVLLLALAVPSVAVVAAVRPGELGGSALALVGCAGGPSSRSASELPFLRKTTIPSPCSSGWPSPPLFSAWGESHWEFSSCHPRWFSPLPSERPFSWSGTAFKEYEQLIQGEEMKKALLLVNSAVGAALLTLVVAAGALLYLMFSTDEDNIRKEGLFGAVFFETREVREGVIGSSMGVDDPVGLIVVFVVLFGLVTLTQLAFHALKAYRADLIRERSHG